MDVCGTPSCRGWKNVVIFSFRMAQMHLPVNLRKVSPTAMGRMSGRKPFLNLFKAINLPPARKTDTGKGAFPDANKYYNTFTR